MLLARLRRTRAVSDLEEAREQKQARGRIVSMRISGYENYETRLRRKDKSLVDVDVRAHHLDSGRYFAYVDEIA